MFNALKYIFILNKFSCYDVDGDERLYYNIQILCYTSTYYIFANGVALPAIIIWGLGIPFFAFVILFKDRH